MNAGRSAIIINLPNYLPESIEMVAALCSHANDGAPVVRRQITESLVDIGRKQPNLALSACLDFLKRNAKVRVLFFFYTLALLVADVSIPVITLFFFFFCGVVVR